MEKFNIIKCDNVNYRKGYIEITPEIHGDCINIECWDVHVDVDLSSTDIESEDFPEDGITGNTEIEMSITEAEQLVKQIQHAIAQAKST